MKWESLAIKDFAEVFDGPHATPKDSSSGPVFLGIKNILPDGGIDLSNVRHISDEEFPRWTKRVVPSLNDIVFSYEATLHRYAMIPEGFVGCLGRRMALVRVDESKVLPKFLYYVFLSDYWRGFIEGNKLTGATVDRIPLTEFPDYEVPVPPLPTQQKIASVLSAYDELIENNLRRIALLEEKASLEYKIILTEEKLEEHRLDEFVQINQYSLKKGQYPEFLFYVDISSVTPGRINDKTKYSAENAPGRARRKVQHQDIIWSCVRPNRKSYAMVWRPEENMIVSTGFAVISATGIPPLFLYQCLSTDSFVRYLENNATGSAYPAVNSKDFENAIISIPSKKIMQMYQESMVSVYEMIYILQKQNTQLREARDILLPKLMSGEVQV